MSHNSALTIPESLRIAPIVSKKGKISASAQKASDVMQGIDSRTLVALATSKGSLNGTAQQALKSLAPTLGEVLSGPIVQNWGTLLVMLVNAYGLASYNRATMKGRAGVMAYVQLCHDAAHVALKQAETIKQADKANALIADLETTAACVNRLNDAHEAARMAAEHAQNEALAYEAAMIQTGLVSETETAPVAETAPVSETETA